MRRRAMLAATLGAAGPVGLLALATPNARAQPWPDGVSAPAHAPGVRLVLECDGVTLTLARFHAARGPLDRHGARPGGWWQLLYVPLWPGWPVELLLRAQRRGHALQVTAFDAAPGRAPGVAVSLPLQADHAGTSARWSSVFVLPERSAVDGVFLLLELWRADFAAPPPLAVRLRSLAAADAALERAPRRPHPARSTAAPVEPPPSPLMQTQRERAAFELPLLGPPRVVAPAWPPETPR